MYCSKPGSASCAKRLLPGFARFLAALMFSIALCCAVFPSLFKLLSDRSIPRFGNLAFKVSVEMGSSYRHSIKSTLFLLQSLRFLLSRAIFASSASPPEIIDRFEMLLPLVFDSDVV